MKCLEQSWRNKSCLATSEAGGIQAVWRLTLEQDKKLTIENPISSLTKALMNLKTQVMKNYRKILEKTSKKL